MRTLPVLCCRDFRRCVMSLNCPHWDSLHQDSVECYDVIYWLNQNVQKAGPSNATVLQYGACLYKQCCLKKKTIFVEQNLYFVIEPAATGFGFSHFTIIRLYKNCRKLYKSAELPKTGISDLSQPVFANVFWSVNIITCLFAVVCVCGFSSLSEDKVTGWEEHRIRKIIVQWFSPKFCEYFVCVDAH